MLTSSALIKFCATGKSGLGHLRRSTNIAAAIRATAPEQKLALVTNAPVAGLSPSELALFDEIVCVSREAMAGVLSEMETGPVVIDTAAIEDVGFLPDPLCLVLRETAAEKLSDFRLFNGRMWDRVIVPSPLAHWLPPAQEIGATDIVHAGWIYRAPASGTTPVLPSRQDVPRILVATGGGGTRATAATLRREIDAVIAAFRATGIEADILQVAGPRLAAEGHLAGASARIDVGARLNEAFAEADAVITTVGYNSVLELARLTTPALLVPISRTYDDQSARAEAWGHRLGLAHRPDDPARSASWLRDAVVSGARRTAVDLGPSGCNLAAQSILELCARAEDPAAVWRFRKPRADGSLEQTKAVASRASILFRAGVPTLPARVSGDGSGIDMLAIEGETLRQRWRKLDAPFNEPQDLAGLLVAERSWIDSLVSLHNAGNLPDAGALGLAPLAPLAKVHKRLDREPATAGNLTDEALNSIRQAAAATTLAIAARGAFRSDAIVHGDLHAGQVLLPADSSNALIIDLDDLALGPVEFDLANFVANIVTSSGLYTGPADRGFAVLSAAISDAYANAGGRRPDAALMRIFGAASLLRRALKLAAVGREWPSTPEICSVIQALLNASAHATAQYPHSTRVANGSATAQQAPGC